MPTLMLLLCIILVSSLSFQLKHFIMNSSSPLLSSPTILSYPLLSFPPHSFLCSYPILLHLFFSNASPSGPSSLFFCLSSLPSSNIPVSPSLPPFSFFVLVRPILPFFKSYCYCNALVLQAKAFK